MFTAGIAATIPAFFFLWTFLVFNDIIILRKSGNLLELPFSIYRKIKGQPKRVVLFLFSNF
nr:MAG TPA: hypothetical protein [Caudoviricetes sp.]